MILKKKKLSQNDHTQRDRVFSSLSLLSYFLWGIKEVYKLLCWTWILADFSFLQHYTPSHEHVAPHESWQMKQLGNYPDAEWEYCYWWKVFSPKIDLWCDSSSFEMYTRACIDGAICCLLPCTTLFLWLECLYFGFAAFRHFLFPSFNGGLIPYEIVISGCYHSLKAKVLGNGKEMISISWAEFQLCVMGWLHFVVP